MPIYFDCQRCTACCRWPGQVLLNDAEITRLAVFKKLSEHEFIQRYAKLRADRRGLALQEQSDGSCIFLEDGRCAVQPVKPQKCKEFPNFWNFPGFEQVCKAIPQDISREEYDRRMALIRQSGHHKAG